MKTKLMSCLFCVGVGLVPSMASSMNEEVQSLIVHQSNKRALSGIVTDATTNEPLIGVSILIKGTQVGTVTDVDGKFILDVSQNDVLEFSYIGYKSQTLAVEGKTILNVLMTPDNEMLDEVVVVGYGAMKKSDLTGAINHIEADKIMKENPSTLQDILRGAAPGLNVSMSNDAKGGGNLLIRGQRSLKGGNSPLIVLNGMVFQGDLSEINPIDIESIDVLKDASSAAVYGAKSANGVIIISTKKGKEDKPVIRFDASIGMVTMGVNRDVYGCEDYLNYRSDYAALAYGGGNKGYYVKPTLDNLNKYHLTEEQWKNYDAIGQSVTNLEDAWLQRIGLGELERKNYFSGKNFNWYDASFQMGLKQDYNISLSGKSNKVNYYWSLGYLDSKGLVVGDRFKNYRTSIRLDAQITNFLEAGVHLNLQSRNEGFQPVDWVGQIKNSPYSLPYNDDGTLNPWPMGEKQTVANVRGVNSFYNNAMSSKSSGTESVLGNFYLKVKLPFNISYQFSYSPRYSYFHGRNWTSSESVFDEKNGVADRTSIHSLDWTLDNMIKWNYTFANKHSFDLTLLQSAEQYEIWEETMSGSNFLPSDILEWHNMSAAIDKKLSSNDRKHTGDALMARLFYSYDNRYMLTASVRRDGFSAFGKSNPRATFPAMALAWNFANEKFFDWDIMNYGKFRFSWGKNGNRDIGIYQALSQLTNGDGGRYPYVTLSGDLYELGSLQVDRMANYDLKWETTTAWNVGLDFGLFNNRVSGSVEWYYMPTSDLLIDRSLPDVTGFTSVVSNLGKVVNSGFEVSLNTVNVNNKKFVWSSNFTLSHNKNRIKHLYYQYEDILDDEGNIIGSKEIDDINRNWFVGRDISTIWDYEFMGIWQEEEAEEAAKYGQNPGDAKARDVNKDYRITQEDKVFLGQTTPKFRLSLRNDFTIFDDWNLSFGLYSNLGHKEASTEYLNYFDFSGDYLNTYKRNYWTPENRSNDYARLKSTLPSNVQPKKMLNKGFIRLETLSLSYNVPCKFLKKINISKVNLFATVRNVAVWTFDKRWDYWDPETGSIIPRTYTIGTSVTF